MAVPDPPPDDATDRPRAATPTPPATAETPDPRRTAWAPVTAVGRWTGDRVRRLRAWWAGGETGMARLFDVHATAIAGDTLVGLGLAGTIFFTAPLGEARSNVGLYLLVTMVPFAVLAPLVGPLVDHFRHGRRYALAATMLGRALLAWLIADHLDDFLLYPAAFAVLVLSRAYGVARAATVPRLLPQRLGLSRTNARGSVYGTAAGAVVTPLGLAAFWFGPQWPLRVAAVIFLVGMVVSLRLPARADSTRPQARTRTQGIWAPGRRPHRVLTSRLVVATLLGSVTHRALYGFLLVFLAFAVRAEELPTTIAGHELGVGAALSLISGTLVGGTFVAVVIGSRLSIRRPLTVQAIGLLVVTATAAVAAIGYTLPLVTLLCLVAAVSSGLAKVAIDSAIQERVDEQLRTTAFAHSETMLMLAFVLGAGLGLVPAPSQLGVAAVAALLTVATVRAVVAAVALRRAPLSGQPAGEPSEPAERAGPAPSAEGTHAPPAHDRTRPDWKEVE